MAFVINGEHPDTLVVQSQLRTPSTRSPEHSRGSDILSYEGIAEANRLTAVGWVNINWNALRVTQSGFAKTVRPLGTVVSSPTAAYSSEAEVTTGDGYEYRLRFVTNENDRADHIVLYDVLETGVSGEGSSTSAWKGGLRKVDVSQIAGKATAGGTATCAPVVYYSTTVTDRNSVNGAYFDLSDTSKWSETPPEDLSAVTAIAVDCSKDTAGNDFVLDKRAVAHCPPDHGLARTPTWRATPSTARSPSSASSRQRRRRTTTRRRTTGSSATPG